MANKNEGKVPAGGFQLDPKDPQFDTGNMLLNGPVRALINWMNKADFNKDGIADLPQLAPFFFKILPHVTAFASAIDWKKLSDLLMNLDVFKNKEVATNAVEKMGAVADDASKVISA